MDSSSKNWDKRVWHFPLPHDFLFGFGLTADNAATTKKSTIVPYLFQDNAIIDYETIKVNPENEDFAVSSRPNCAAGSVVSKAMVSWHAYVPSVASEIGTLNFKHMNIHTSMLNRLDAFDKKTGDTVEDILRLQHETTDEQAGPLFNAAKLFEGHNSGNFDYHADVPFLSTNQQPEGVNFNLETYFDALHYYTNKEMLKQVTDRMMNFQISIKTKNVRGSDKFIRHTQNVVPSMCKFQNPYTFCGGLFYLPIQGDVNQIISNSDTLTQIEHLTILGRVRFNEFNPDFNHSRA